MGKATKLVGIALGLAVALGIGVTIGWFSKPESDVTSDANDVEEFDFKLIDEFISAVDSQHLEKETEHLSNNIRWATSQGTQINITTPKVLRRLLHGGLHDQQMERATGRCVVNGLPDSPLVP